MTKRRLGAEQLVGNDQRAHRIVACPPARIADHMRIAFGKTGIFGRVETRVHAGENGEAPRGRQTR